MSSLPAGTKVRIQGLVKAAQHNGKIGKVSKASACEGRLAVKLEDGTVLAVKINNLDQILPEKESENPRPPLSSFQPKERTLKRDNAMLREFDGNPDPNVLALYHHFKDHDFDCFNAPEYNTQMLCYYENDIKVVMVLPRKIMNNEHILVCLQHDQHEKNTLCEVAFNCGRSFAGISMLIKTRCFACNKPSSPRCKCQCACFCSKACREKSEVGVAHDKVCNLIQRSKVVVDDECLQLIE